MVQLETDHKPFIPLLGQKSLDLLPPRVLRFRLRLMRFHYKVEHFVEAIRAVLPASTDRLKAYAQAQANDRVCSRLIEFFKSGCPARNQLCRELKEYWSTRGNLTLDDTLCIS